MARNYSIGLDIGTNSVGFVAIDQNQKILKYNNRFAFGSHEFLGAETAEARRLKRGSRRRYNRRKKRIQLTQDLFRSHMKQEKFFSDKETDYFWRNSNEFENRTLSEIVSKLRLKQSRYPTIYHLRNELIASNEKADLQLIYLAIHNLVKYRGHFLQSGEWETNTSSTTIAEQLEDLYHYYNNSHLGSVVAVESIDFKAVELILKNQKLSKKERHEEVNKTINIKILEELAKLLVGLTISMNKLFPESVSEASLTKKKFSFLKHEIIDFADGLADEELELFEILTPLYQEIQLYDLLQGHKYVAAAKIDDFKNYRKDLTIIQRIFNTYLDETDYRKFFITDKKVMREYEQKPNSNTLKTLSLLDQYSITSKSEEDFFKELKKALEQALVPIKDTIDGNAIESLLKKIDDQTLLKKQKTKQNAAIPYQNNLYEAQHILKNQQQHYAFITDDFINKIKQIISFRIPYYIGPLTKTNDEKFGWVSRNQSSVNITPFNFDEVVNKSESAERFIRRMTNKCTYLKEQDVLPKCSLLYEEYELLNELNGVQIRSKIDEKNARFRLSEDEKIWALENIFLKIKSVKLKRFISELRKSPFERFQTDEELTVYGTQKEEEFATSLSMHIDMKRIFGEDYLKKETMIEEIIEWLTIFEEREIFVLKVHEKYAEITEEQLELLMRLKPTGWGKLSRKLLVGLPIEEQKSKQIFTVIDLLRDTNENFMELMRTTNLKEVIEKTQPKNKKKSKKIIYADIDELPGSPALKRGIWHAIKIVEELTAIFGEPTNIILEVARSDEQKKRTTSRKDLLKQYQANSKKTQDKKLEEFLKDHNKNKTLKVDNERVWLYLTQGGKCLYSGKTLEFNLLSSYEIDHILPQSFVKDNSISNKALVLQGFNQKKGGELTALQVIDRAEQGKMKATWTKLEKNGMISKKKYNSLMKPFFSNADKEGFIARQLVETRQIVKNIAVLLEERFENTSIHGVKAGIISNFRQSMHMPKIRAINNKHHAMDALYAATFIQMILNKYGYNFLEFTFDKQDLYDKWNRRGQTKKDFFLFEKFKGLKMPSNLAQKEISTIEYYREAFEEVPWNTTKQKRYGEAMFYNETIDSPKNAETVKYDSEKNKIGVHSGVKKRCSWVIKYDEINAKGTAKLVRKIVDVPTIYYEQAKNVGLTTLEMAEALVIRESNKPIKNVELQYELVNYQKVIENKQPYYFMSSSERHVGKQFELPIELLMNLNNLNDKNKSAEQHSLEDLQAIFSQFTTQFFEQYPYFSQMKSKEKIESYTASIKTVVDLNKGIEELYKSAQNNGSRSDLFSSRLTKGFILDDLYVLEESITGLKYRKPRKI